MAEGRREEDWQHTAHLTATCLSMFSKKPVQSDEVNPMVVGKRKAEAREQAASMPKMSVAALGQLMGAKPAKRRATHGIGL